MIKPRLMFSNETKHVCAEYQVQVAEGGVWQVQAGTSTSNIREARESLKFWEKFAPSSQYRIVRVTIYREAVK